MREIVDGLDGAKGHKITKITELAMRGSAKDMLMFSARESADSRGECTACLDTPDSPARADPQLERMVLKGEKVYENPKDGLTSNTIHSERTMCLDKDVVVYTVEE